jgi:hypothetical protein
MDQRDETTKHLPPRSLIESVVESEEVDVLDVVAAVDRAKRLWDANPHKMHLVRQLHGRLDRQRFHEIDAHVEWELARAALRAKRRAASRGDGVGTAFEMPKPKTEKPAKTKAEEYDARACELLISHRDWSKKKIANAVGCAQSVLSDRDRCPRFVCAYEAAREARKDNLPRGYRDGEGRLEARSD